MESAWHYAPQKSWVAPQPSSGARRARAHRRTAYGHVQVLLRRRDFGWESKQLPHGRQGRWKEPSGWRARQEKTAGLDNTRDWQQVPHRARVCWSHLGTPYSSCPRVLVCESNRCSNTNADDINVCVLLKAMLSRAIHFL